MKTVFKSNELAHVWANQGAPMGRCASSMSFDGDAFSSYSTVIARRIRHKGKVAYVIDRASFSVTTSQHQNAVAHALHQHPEKQFRINSGRRGQYLDFTPAKLRDVYLAEFNYKPTDYNGKPVEPSRFEHKRAEAFLSKVASLESAIEVCDYFGLPASKLKQKLGALRGEIIEQTKIVEAHTAKLRQRRNEKEVRQRAAREARAISLAEAILRGEEKLTDYWTESYLDSRPDLIAAVNALRIAKDKAEIEAWQGGYSNQANHRWPAMLRAEMPEGSNEQQLVTSKGARVPLTDAERSFRFCMKVRARGWHRNGDRHAVGMYQLDAVNEQGVVAGCHRIAWDEIERFAKTQGWL